MDKQTETIKIVRSLVLAYGKGKLKVGKLNQLYRQLEGKPVPLFGHSSIVSLLKTLSNEFTVKREADSLLVYAVGQTNYQKTIALKIELPV